MRLAFIGLGNMANAILSGIIRTEKVAPEDIIGAAPTASHRAQIEERYGMHTTESDRQAAMDADVVFLCVKPVIMPVVLEEILPAVRQDTILISVAAGKTTKWIADYFKKPVKIVRCMPNTPALVGEGCTAVCRNENVTDDEMMMAMGLIESFGTAEIVSEALMDVVGGVSGSSPAFVFMFIEALADAAVKGGMPRQQAYRFAAQSVLGSAKLLLETGRHPGELKDMVCSPGGTTIEGVEALERGGMRAAVMSAVDACIEKTRLL